MSMCRVVSCVGRGCFLWPVSSLGKTLLTFVMIHFVLQSQICLFLQVFLDFLLLHSSPLKWKWHLFWLLVLEGLIGLHRIIQLGFFSISGWDINLDCHDIEWFALETNRDHSVFFEITPKCCILDSLLTRMTTPFLLRDPAHRSRYNGHLNEICLFLSILVHWFLKYQCSL